MKKLRGFTLLEIIIVIAIIGVVITSITRLIIRQIEEEKRQLTSDTIIQEVYAIQSFIQSAHLDVINNESNQGFEKKTNPLYDDGSNNIYKKRTTNNIDETIQSLGFLAWSKDGQDLDRRYFTDEYCGLNNDGVSLGFNQISSLIKCNTDSFISNSNFELERIDLVGNKDNRDIARVDYFLSYKSNDEDFTLPLYSSFFERALNKYSIIAERIDIIERNNDKTSQWSLKKTKDGKETLTIGNAINHLDSIQKNKKYGIRISFYVNEGIFLKSDGSIAAKKLCWSKKHQSMGACLSPSEDENDRRNKLVLESGETDKKKQAPGFCWSKNDNKTVTCLSMKKDSNEKDGQLKLMQVNEKGEEVGSLVANIIMEDNGVYTTPVKAQYITTNIHGYLNIDVQRCPKHPEEPASELYPRASIVTSSLIGSNKGNLNVQAKTITQNNFKELSNITAVAWQLNRVENGNIGDANYSYQWEIESRVDMNDLFSSHTSATVSGVLLTWCSSEQQK